MEDKQEELDLKVEKHGWLVNFSAHKAIDQGFGFDGAFLRDRLPKDVSVSHMAPNSPLILSSDSEVGEFHIERLVDD